MKTKKQIQELLAEHERDLEKDDKADFDNALPCCDRREIEVSIDILNWILS